MAVDNDPRACYFRQVLCGKFIRMALILKLLGFGGVEMIIVNHCRTALSSTISPLVGHGPVPGPGLDKLECEVAVIKNASSGKYGKKDILKINEVIDLNYEMLGYIDPHITVNIIRGGERMEKIHPHLPETITGVIRCKTPRCITSIEQELPHIFRLTDREHGVYRCLYCDTKGGKR